MFPTIEALTVIKTDAGPINVRDFSYFLYLFRAVYVSARDVQCEYDTSGFETDEKTLKNIVDRVRYQIQGLSRSGIADLSIRSLESNEDLTILDIHRENPLGVLFGGIAVAFAVAVIISGGKFELGPLKVELPSLGTGLSSLRSAFGKERNEF